MEMIACFTPHQLQSSHFCFPIKDRTHLGKVVLDRTTSRMRFSFRLCDRAAVPSRNSSTFARCNKMFVPEGFGEQSPEARAANMLHNYFTYLAVQIVLAQVEDYNREAYDDLKEFVDRTSLNDGDKFCAQLLREHQSLALRILEVRSVYARRDFEWENVKKLAIKHMEKSNTSLMREFLMERSKME